jgi:DedD protein
MEQGLKERLVGAAVLVAIAVWLVPWVLDGPEEGAEAPASSLELPSAEEPMPMRTQTLRLGDAAETSAEQIPPPAPTPSVPEVTTAQTAPRHAEPQAEPEPKTDGGTEPAVVAVAPPAERPAPVAAPATGSPPPPKPAAAAASGDWTVQLGSFAEEANARRLAQRASTFGYKAEVSSYRSSGRTLYRVRVGPQATRAAADAAASALKAHGLDARVVAAR